MAARRTLELKTQQRQELEEYHDHNGRSYVRECCGALLRLRGARCRTPWRVRIAAAARLGHALWVVTDI